MSSGRILITCRQMQSCLPQFISRFDEAGLEVDTPEVIQQPSEEELIAIIGGYDGMIAGDDPLTARVLEHAQRMRIISKWGVGVDGIDRQAAENLGIKVTNTPAVFGDDVADVAAGYLVLLARRLHVMHSSVAAGGWHKHEGRRLSGSRLGIVALGSIGQAVARRGNGFGMQVSAFDVSPEAADAAATLGVTMRNLDDLFATSDYLVLCCPLTEATRHLVNERTLALMPQGANLINVARGPVVDEAALAEALASGNLAAAALDVFEIEPLPSDSPLRGFEQCVFGSHNASNTREGVIDASARAVDNLFEGLGIQ